MALTMQENNKIEIKKFDKEICHNFIEMLKGFVITQVRVLREQQIKHIQYCIVHLLTKARGSWHHFRLIMESAVMSLMHTMALVFRFSLMMCTTTKSNCILSYLDV